MSSINFLSTSSKLLISEAKDLGLSVEIIDADNNVFFIGNSEKKILFKNTDFGVNSALGFKLVNDKSLCYTLLERNGFPIAKSLYLKKENFNNFKESDISGFLFPLVIKPLSEAHGNGVRMNIRDYGELQIKLETSFLDYDTMIIQEQIKGDEIRMLVFDNEIIAAYIRKPPVVTGDGKRTIQELVEYENTTNPLRGEQYENVLTSIEIDDEVLDTLKKQSLNILSIPREGQNIILRRNSNVGTGGTLVNVSSILHPQVKQGVIESLAVFGLHFAGVDIILQDPRSPLLKENGVILEINATPGLGGHKEMLGVNSGNLVLRKLFGI
ncbi:hypothetical protein LAT59_00560 [Candidatus Gracilibacteria bacterium]|nr:hypothetical protein [Candidatus Gracilibacteria bacterium]